MLSGKEYRSASREGIKGSQNQMEPCDSAVHRALEWGGVTALPALGGTLCLAGSFAPASVSQGKGTEIFGNVGYLLC